MPEILHSNSETTKLSVVKRLGKIALRVTLASALIYPVADYYGAKWRWHENDTYAVMVRDGVQEENEDALIVLPGFGNKDGKKIADSIAPAIPQKYKIGTVNYSDEAAVDMGKGADAGKELADQIIAFDTSEGIDELSFYLHSMATNIFLQTLPHLQGIHINTIVMDCSPYDSSTVYEQENVERGAETWYQFGIISKTLYEINEATRGENKNNDLSFFEQIYDGARISITGSSPFLAKSNAEVLVDTNPAEFKDLLSNIQRIVYLIPENPDNDHTVKIEAALLKWQELLGDKLQVVRVPKGGHADPMYRTDEYQSVLRTIFPEPKEPQLMAPKIAILLKQL